MADINVIIKDNTQIIGREGFGKTVLFLTSQEKPFKEYDISEDLSLVLKDFDAESVPFKMIEAFANANPRPRKVSVFGKKLEEEAKGTDLKEALINFNHDADVWYKLVLENQKAEFVEEAAKWCEQNGKVLYATLTEETISVAEKLKEIANTKLFYSTDKEKRIESAVAGLAATRVPGSFTYKFKNLPGIQADKLAPEKIKELTEKNINCYIPKFKSLGMEKNQLNSGLATNGDFADRLEGMTYIKDRISGEVAKILMETEKVPFTNGGIHMIKSCVESALKGAFEEGLIRPDNDGNGNYKVSYIPLEDLRKEDVKKRILKGITFEYVEAGAIESATIEGEVVLNL